MRPLTSPIEQKKRGIGGEEHRARKRISRDEDGEDVIQEVGWPLGRQVRNVDASAGREDGLKRGIEELKRDLEIDSKENVPLQ